MKNSTLLKRVPDLLTKNGTLKRTYINAIEALKFLSRKESKYYPIMWTKSLGHYKLQDKSYKDMIYILINAKIDFTEGNDAPRNGKEGTFIQLTNKGINQVSGLNLDQLLTF